MIDLQQAEHIAGEYLKKLGDEIGMSLQLVRRQDLSYGWLFFYNSQAYLQSGEIGSMLAGNAPFIVEACDGSLHVLGTAAPVEIYLKEYEISQGHTEK
jgi:hypothetical protein